MCELKSQRMEVNEKLRFNFSGEKVFGTLGALLVFGWGIHTYIDKQTKRDDSQDAKIEKVDLKVNALTEKMQEQNNSINSKLDKIIEKQEIDHDKVDEMVIRHEYLNLNKGVK